MNIVTCAKGKPITTSVVIANRFGKLHKNVIQAIRNLECSDEFNRLNFQPVEYIDNKGECRPMYNITRDGFSFLAMGFTGKDAAAWQEKFIGAFNAMEAELIKLSIVHDERWSQARLEGIGSRREGTDAIQRFVGYAEAQGSKNANRYYQILTQDIYRELFVLDDTKKVDREHLTEEQLTLLSIAERVLSKGLIESIKNQEEYKTARVIVIDKVRQLAGLIGRSVPGVSSRQLLG